MLSLLLLTPLATATIVSVCDAVCQAEWLARNNEARAAENACLAPATWSTNLATSATNYAVTMCNTGVFAHSGLANTGENLYFSSGIPNPTPTFITKAYTDEKAFTTNLPFDGCQPGKECGHFFQIVWQGVSQIGCGTCKAAGNDNKFYSVCHYITQRLTGRVYNGCTPSNQPAPLPLPSSVPRVPGPSGGVIVVPSTSPTGVPVPLRVPVPMAPVPVAPIPVPLPFSPEVTPGGLIPSQLFTNPGLALSASSRGACSVQTCVPRTNVINGVWYTIRCIPCDTSTRAPGFQAVLSAPGCGTLVGTVAQDACCATVFANACDASSLCTCVGRAVACPSSCASTVNGGDGSKKGLLGLLGLLGIIPLLLCSLLSCCLLWLLCLRKKKTPPVAYPTYAPGVLAAPTPFMVAPAPIYGGCAPAYDACGPAYDACGVPGFTAGHYEPTHCAETFVH